MASRSCSEAHEAIQRFLSSAREPVLIEPGMDPMPLSPGGYEVQFERGRLHVQAWTAQKTLSRLITGIQSESGEGLEVTVQRFGGKSGSLRFLDRAHAASERLTRRACRLSFRDLFRRFLSRNFPGWKIAELSADADLQHSLSPAYTRALIRKGAKGLAAIGVPESADADGALTYGLIWLDYLRRREPKLAIEGLILLLPERQERTTCHRIRHLNRQMASFRVYVRSDEWEQEIDIADSGNIDTRLIPRDSAGWMPDWLCPVRSIEGVESVETGEGLSLRVCGLEFARCSGTEVRFGIGARRTANDWHLAEIRALAQELICARHAGNRAHPLYAAAPERWLESLVRRQITTIDAALHPTPVYGQAPTFLSGERGVIDLLAAGSDGRLTVIEVKASEDPHLPLQALEYWARVKWHQSRGELAALGYFRHVPLTNALPRMVLVAPALHFHPTTDTILRFFPSEIEVVRIGVAAGWRSGLKVAFRTIGTGHLPANSDRGI